MKKLLSLMVVLFLMGTMNALAQEKKYSVYAIGFYNLENLTFLIPFTMKVTMTTSICLMAETSGRV